MAPSVIGSFFPAQAPRDRVNPINQYGQPYWDPAVCPTPPQNGMLQDDFWKKKHARGHIHSWFIL